MESSTTKLSDSEHAALIEPLMDEYHAWNVYSQVMHDFGPVRPFSRIRESEARHAEALQNLLRKYGHPIPPNHPIEPIPRFNTLREACEAAVAAEEENALLYERLMRSTNKQDILFVFRNLQEASQERHLLAFRRCRDRNSS